jgi:hypothetical protein
MIEFYHRNFYHIYKFYLGFEKNANAVLTTLIIISAIQFFNLMIIFLVMSFFGVDFVNLFIDLNNLGVYVFGIYTLMVILNYIYFTTDDRYKSILKEYSSKPIKERKKGAKIILIYAIASIALIFILAPLR